MALFERLCDERRRRQAEHFTEMAQCLVGCFPNSNNDIGESQHIFRHMLWLHGEHHQPVHILWQQESYWLQRCRQQMMRFVYHNPVRVPGARPQLLQTW